MTASLFVLLQIEVKANQELSNCNPTVVINERRKKKGSLIYFLKCISL